MKWPVQIAVAILCFTGPAIAQNIGDVTPVVLTGGGATLTLDFSDRDYELILYSTVTSAEDTTVTFSYTVSGAAVSARPLVLRRPVPAEVTDRDRLEALLREQERNLADRLRREGGWHPPLHKAVQPAQTSRTFTFGAFGGVSSDRTVQATLVASNTRALGYVDNALPASDENITAANILAMLDEFSNTTYPVVTPVFGDPSDVDADGKVIFLFTHLVDQVGGIAGFYSSASLFSTQQGGNDNLADMMFISPTQSLNSYKSLLAHEFQHLISYNQHVLVKSGQSEESWLNEALSHVTEDLVDGHVAGGNPGLVEQFMNAPGNYALTGDAQLNTGIRGAAYLFARGLIEDFGDDIPGRLVKTERAGIENVEAVTGQTFQDLYQTFASRLFLSGAGLNAQAAFNYTFPFFTEQTTSHRILPPPRETALSENGAPLSGSVRPAAPAYLRLTGSTAGGSVTIQTETAGDFRALLISLPSDFRPPMTLPADYFPQITLDAPLSGTFDAGEGISISGVIPDPSVSQLLLSFEALDGVGDEIKFAFDVTGGQFGGSILFDPSQAGDYKLTFFMGQKGESLPSVGSFSPVTITQGSGTVNIPVDFFSGITLDATLPAQYKAGSGASITGRVTDSSIEVLALVFTPEGGGNDIRVQTSVSGGAFRKGFIFTPDQAGSYTLNVFGGPSEGGLPHRGSFSSITVTATGSEQVLLPVDIFDTVLLDAPLTAAFFAGQEIRISGTISDLSATQILFRFDPRSGSGENIRFFTDVTNGRFSQTITFDASQTGDYDLILFAGTGTLLSLDSFSPMQVLSAQPDIQLLQTALNWDDLAVGARQDLPFTLLNQETETLSVTGITSNSSAFSAAPESFTLSPGDSAVVTVTFSPTAVGQIVDTLRISSNDPDLATARIVLTGAGIVALAPELSLRISALDFGSVEVGATAEQLLTILNTGADTLNVETVSGASGPFAANLPTVIPVFRIAPGDSVEIRVSFAPEAAGDFSGTLSITGNIPTTEIALLGTATSSETPSPPSPDFNGDGIVNFSDFVEFARAFGAQESTPNYDAKFDLDSNGQIGFSDFVIFAASFGKSV